MSPTVQEHNEVDLLLGRVATIEGDRVKIDNEGELRRDVIDRVMWAGAFSASAATRALAHDRIRSVAEALGIFPWSIAELYAAMGRGEVSGFTVPAINVRAMAFETCRGIFRAARAKEVGALIFEIARSEMGYTEQRPSEYAAVVLAAAIKERWRGPVFIQGDHFQANAKKFAADPEKEIGALEQLIDEAIPAGFLNIDIDTSTLVDLSQDTLAEQQRANSENCARLTRFIREREPDGVSISIGGEIGEVGKANSTPEEFRAYMDGYLSHLPNGMPGISKVSIQTGTSHGGVVLADGSVAEVKIDFDCIRTISDIARQEYGLAGAVQHGASTLPDDAFHNFPRVGAAEIHLATGFQNMMYEHPAFPADLKEEMYEWCREHCASERKEGDTDDQFLYRARKKAIGPFKSRLWGLPGEERRAIGQTIEDKVAFLFDQLAVPGSAAAVEKHVHPKPVARGKAVAAGFVRDDEAGD